MSRFDDIDLVDVPDQWDDIVQRADQVPLPLVEPSRHRGWLIGGGVAASVIVVAFVAGVLSLDRSADDETVTVDTEVVESSAPELACSSGELAAGSIPDDAVFGEGSIWPVEEFADIRTTATWSWKVDGLDVQLMVPGIVWIDLVGERFEYLTGDLEATVVYGGDESGEGTVHVIAASGLAGPCDRFEVVVAGGTEPERKAVALDAAESLQWSPTGDLQVSDLDDVDAVRRWAVRDAAGRAIGNGTADVYVYEWQVGDDVPARWTTGETNDGARRWTTVVVGGPGLTFTSLRGPAGSPPSSGQVLTTFFGVGGERGLYISDDASLPAHLQPTQGPSPMLVVGSPAAD